MPFDKIGLAPGEGSWTKDHQVFKVAAPGLESALQTLIGDRCKRAHHFGPKLFSDPAWDILLVLALAETQYQRLSVSSLCDRLDVPATTVLRWIARLANEGLICRREDVLDKRRTHVELSRTAYAAMVSFCSANPAHVAMAA